MVLKNLIKSRKPQADALSDDGQLVHTGLLPGFEALPTVVLVLDKRSLKIAYANPSAESMLEMSRKQLTQAHWPELFANADELVEHDRVDCREPLQRNPSRCRARAPGTRAAACACGGRVSRSRARLRAARTLRERAASEKRSRGAYPRSDRGQQATDPQSRARDQESARRDPGRRAIARVRTRRARTRRVARVHAGDHQGVGPAADARRPACSNRTGIRISSAT